MQDSVYDDAGWRDLHPDTPLVALTYHESEAQFAECVVAGNYGAARAYARIAESRLRNEQFVDIQKAIAKGAWPHHGDYRADDDPKWCDGSRSRKGSGE